ncbi:MULTISPECIES: STAS domain-containing protein [Streptomyces]
MTRPVSRLSLHADFQQGVVTVHVGGSLEFGVTDSLLATVTDHLDRALAGSRPVRQLNLDLAGVTFVDSMGLAALLMARRVTDARGVALRLSRRPESLDRLLRLTCTFDYFMAPAASGGAATPDQ